MSDGSDASDADPDRDSDPDPDRDSDPDPDVDPDPDPDVDPDPDPDVEPDPATDRGPGKRTESSPTPNDEELVEAARRAGEAAYAPYSEYAVGAALLTADGRVFGGCNVENANYSNSLHAEEVALGTAVAAGHRDFEAVAVSSGERDGVTPCGMCRQTLAEFCDDDLRVICDLGDGTREYALGELLPEAIDAGTLDVDRA